MSPSSAKPKLLFVHQGYELYGSDKVFLQSLKAVRQNWPEANITVHLPQQGVLSDKAQAYADKVTHGDMWVLHKSRLRFKNWRGILQAPKSLMKAYRLAKNHDAVYINTSVIMSYNLVARFSKTPRILHIHEFKTGLTGKVLGKLSGFSKPSVIANSNATAKAFSHVKLGKVILNAAARPQHEFECKTLNGELNLLLLGRISGWKGHLLALQAMQQLRDKGYKVRLRIVGDVFEGQRQHKEMLHDYISKNALDNHVEFYGFTTQTDPHYEWAHIVVVPSTDPEPFGLVAVEAMARKRPVIAAHHGGLLEIVEQDKTGLFFEPRNEDDLVKAVEYYLQQPEQLARHGTVGYQRFIDQFQEDRYNQEIVNFLKAHLND